MGVMKELSIEEKAKRYDEAIEKLRTFYRDYDIVSCLIDVKEELANLIPELKESKDEEIRKDIVTYLVQSANSATLKVNAQKFNKWIAWLEKQGEQKSTNHQFTPEQASILDKHIDKFLVQKPIIIIPKFKVGDEIKTANEAPLTITKITDSGYWSEDLFICSFDNAAKWELVEQNPVDKVEPKFKVGNWIVNNDNGCIYQIKSIRNDEYCLWLIDSKVEGFLRIGDIDNECDLWTIEDAKDGDVLVASDGSIFLFAGVVDCACKYYVALTACNDIKINKEVDGGYWETSRAVHPAIKEQRDTLMKAMVDAGYTFDFKEKVLKKIEQKSDTDFSDLRTWKYIVDAVWTEKEGIGQYLDSPFTEEVAKKLQKRFGNIEQKPAWSEEDNMHLTNAILAAEKEWGTESCTSKWLKSIKDRVQPQPKQEWSEEDEEMIRGLNNCLDELEKENGWRFTYVNNKNVELVKIRNWLKSLKPHKQWKPSDEQMNTLEYYMHTLVCNEHKEILFGLYTDLKKLREE